MKSFIVLYKYKHNNPLYSLIKLPESSDGIAQIIECLPHIELADETKKQNLEPVAQKLDNTHTEEQANNGNLANTDMNNTGREHNAILTCATQ